MNVFPATRSGGSLPRSKLALKLILNKILFFALMKNEGILKSDI